jgi:hypothetical protein
LTNNEKKSKKKKKKKKKKFDWMESFRQLYGSSSSSSSEADDIDDELESEKQDDDDAEANRTRSLVLIAAASVLPSVLERRRQERCAPLKSLLPVAKVAARSTDFLPNKLNEFAPPMSNSETVLTYRRLDGPNNDSDDPLLAELDSARSQLVRGVQEARRDQDERRERMVAVGGLSAVGRTAHSRNQLVALSAKGGTMEHVKKQQKRRIAGHASGASNVKRQRR